MPPPQSKRQPVTRDLTLTWRRARKTRRSAPSSSAASAGHPSAGPYPGSEALLGDEAHSGRGDRTCLPPEWVDLADKAQEEIKEIQEQIVKLTKAHQRRLLSDSSAPDKEVEAISNNVSTLIRCCEQTIHQIRSSGKDGLLDDEFRQNMQRNLASQLQQLSRQCREAQKEYMAGLKRRKAQEGDLEAAGGGAASSSAAGGGGSGAYSGGAYMQQQLQELDDMEVFAAQRSSETAQILQSVAELNTIFKDLAALVIDQGTVLDRIDFNTEKIYKKSDEAKGQIQKAVKRKKEDDTRAWKCLLVWGAADAVLLLVLLVKYQIKYGLKNVFIFLVVMGVLLTGCYYGLRQYRPKVLTEGPEYFEKMLPEGWSPSAIYKKFRPSPVNAAKMGAAAMRGGGSPV